MSPGHRSGRRSPGWALLAACVIAGLPLGAAAPASSAGVVGGVSARRVLIVSVDGMRPDVLLRARAPNIRGLMQRGAFTMWARTTEVSVTLPSHVSMLTGVSPAVHGVTWNDDRTSATRGYPLVPTLFELAHAAGYSTAMVAGKAKFSTLRKPGSLDWSCVPSMGLLRDSTVTDSAVRLIRSFRPRVMLVHLPNMDSDGHEFGWGSPGQLASMAGADRCVGRLLAALAREGVLDSTLVIVSADHGGAARSHGAGDARSRCIPWIVAGPGVRANLDLSSLPNGDVRTEDTFATACAALGLAPRGPIEGRVVTQAFRSASATR